MLRNEKLGSHGGFIYDCLTVGGPQALGQATAFASRGAPVPQNTTQLGKWGAALHT